MTIASGTVEYSLGSIPITGHGISFSDKELDEALKGQVRGIVFDHEGTANLSELLEGVPETDFESDELEKIFEDDIPPKNWEIGEALAEAYLTQHRNSYFPWPDGRDIRKPKSSLPGADMIGFYGKDVQTLFAFGEVKTSKEKKYPPQVVMYGVHSLNKQLLDLRDQRFLRDKAISYLGYRATKADWKTSYQSAVKNYLKTGGTKFVIFGVLVRDVPPAAADLEKTWELLSGSHSKQTLVELLALYLPPRSIDSLSKRIMEAEKEGEV